MNNNVNFKNVSQKICNMSRLVYLSAPALRKHSYMMTSILSHIPFSLAS